MKNTKTPSVLRMPQISVTLRFNPVEIAHLNGAMMLAMATQGFLPKEACKENAARRALGHRIHNASVRSKAKLDAFIKKTREQAR